MPVAVAVAAMAVAALGGALLCLRDPGVDEDVLGGEALLGVLAEEAADEAARARRDRVGQAELAAPDLGEEALVLLTVEGVPEMRGGKDGVKPRVLVTCSVCIGYILSAIGVERPKNTSRGLSLHLKLPKGNPPIPNVQSFKQYLHVDYIS